MELVWVGNTLNRYYSYYAKAADGAQWTGQYGPVYVYHQAFDSCLNIGSTAAYGRVGMRLIDTDNYGTYTMTLTRG